MQEPGPTTPTASGAAVADPAADATAATAHRLIPAQSRPQSEAFRLTVDKETVRQFGKKKQIAAVAELVWNALDANANRVDVVLRRSRLDALMQIDVVDDGDGMTPERARAAFEGLGTTWKRGRTHTEGTGDRRILNGRHGEGRLWAFALGHRLNWTSTAATPTGRVGVQVTCDMNRADEYQVTQVEPSSVGTGTVVSIDVPEHHRKQQVEDTDAATRLTAHLAFYLRAYPNVRVTFDGVRLDADVLIDRAPVDLPVHLPDSEPGRLPVAVLTVVEWNRHVDDRPMLLCDDDGVVLATHGKPPRKRTVFNYTPYLRLTGVRDRSPAALTALDMTHPGLLEAAARSLRRHVATRAAQISAEVVRNLKAEGVYPYSGEPRDRLEEVERQLFDIVVTAVCQSLPKTAGPRKLMVLLLQIALKCNPAELHFALGRLPSLTDTDRRHLSDLLDSTDLDHAISAATEVATRRKVVARIRRLLVMGQSLQHQPHDEQLHATVARNLWLLGDDWTFARSETSLTSALKRHLDLLGGKAVLEHEPLPPGKPGSHNSEADVVLLRSRRRDRIANRLIVVLKSPGVVGEQELLRVVDYARAMVDDPQYRDNPCTWQFYLVGYDISPTIHRAIQQKDKPPGVAEDQDGYRVWVKTWGQILDAAERQLRFSEEQLAYEADDDRVTRRLRDVYAHYLPSGLTGGGSAGNDAHDGHR